MKSPYELELHEKTLDAPDDGAWEITAVPGGWIYKEISIQTPAAVFVPYFEEPEPPQESEEDHAFRGAIVKCLNDFLGGQRPETEANRLIRVLLKMAKVEEDARS